MSDLYEAGRKIECLEWIIWQSNDASTFTKQCIIWLLRQSMELSQDVCIGLSFKEGQEVAEGIFSMKNINRNTHINALFLLAGLDYFPNCHSGLFKNSTFDGHAQGYTIFMNNKHNGKGSTKLIPNLGEIKAIKRPPNPEDTFTI